MTRCHDVRPNLELFVLDGLPAARRLLIEDHLEHCPACRAEEEECRLLVAAMRNGGDGEPVRPAFERELRAAVASAIESERRRGQARRPAAALCSLAALVLVSVVVWAAWQLPKRRPEVSHGGRGGTAGPVREMWRYEGAASVPASMADKVVTHDSRMYLLRGNRDGLHVAAIDTATGSLRWQSTSRVCGHLAADRSRVFCLAQARVRALSLVALNADDGNELWRYSPDGSPGLRAPCRPVPVHGGRVCWTDGAAVHLVDAATGAPLWTRSMEAEGPLSRAVADESRLYVVTATRLHCLTISSGEELWTEGHDQEARGLRRPLLALNGEHIYFTHSRRGTAAEVLCMHRETREMLWRTSVDGPQFLLATDTGVYLRARQILALDGRTGETIWTRPATGCGPLTLIDGLIHFADSEQRGRLLALDQRTGRTAWEIDGIRSCDALTKIDGTGYVKTRDGTVRALALR